MEPNQKLITLDKWDQKEKETERYLIKIFKLFKKKDTCPMCELIMKTEHHLGSMATEMIFLDDYDKRIHDMKSCFIESYLYCMPKNKMESMDFETAQKKAINQFNALMEFVRFKERN